MCHSRESHPPIPPIAGASITHSELVLESADGTRFSAFGAVAEDAGGVGIVILPDNRGLSGFYEELALRCAELGYSAVAIDYFGRTAGTDPRGADFDPAEHMAQTTQPGVQADIAAAIGHLRGAAGGAADGAQVYAANCVACHQATGAGLPGVFPPLAGSEWALAKDAVPVNIVLQGVTGKLTVKGAAYSGQMPTFKDKLNDGEIAAVLSYVRSNFGNGAGKITADVVKAAREAGKDRSQPWNGDEDLDKLKQ